MPVIDLKKIKTENHWTNRLKDKVKTIGRKMADKAKDTVDFVKDNPETTATLLAAGGAVIGVLGKITKSVTRHANLRQERYNKERYTYDHSTNMYLKYKRPLTKKDLTNIEELRKKGYSKTQALLKLNLLK